jgi:hypothetical protein
MNDAPGVMTRRRQSPEGELVRNNTTGPGLATQRASSIVREDIDWAFLPFVAFGRLARLDGRGGVLQSTVTADLAARLSLGVDLDDCDLPDGPRASIILTAEDMPSDVQRRLVAAGADLDQVHIISTGEVSLPKHTAAPLLSATCFSGVMTATRMGLSDSGASMPCSSRFMAHRRAVLFVAEMRRSTPEGVRDAMGVESEQKPTSSDDAQRPVESELSTPPQLTNAAVDETAQSDFDPRAPIKLN